MLLLLLLLLLYDNEGVVTCSFIFAFVFVSGLCRMMFDIVVRLTCVNDKSSSGDVIIVDDISFWCKRV